MDETNRGDQEDRPGPCVIDKTCLYGLAAGVSDGAGNFFPDRNPPAIRAIPPRIRMAAETNVIGREFSPASAIITVAANAPNPTNDQPTVRTITFCARYPTARIMQPTAATSSPHSQAQSFQLPVTAQYPRIRAVAPSRI